MQKLILWTVLLILVAAGGFWALNAHIYNEKQAAGAASARDAEYLIEGQRVKLKDGYAEAPAAPGAASKITTRYFGNELYADLNSDGREDVAFVLTQESGGSGTFFYAVAALNTERGYLGSDGYFLGDRIAPHPTTPSSNPRHVGVVVFNYAERPSGEPMAGQPSVGKSVYLKLDPESRQWGIVVPDFEGESRSLQGGTEITWHFTPAGEVENIPYTSVAVTVDGTRYEAGRFTGSCSEVAANGGIDGKGLLIGELSAAQCWFAGGGNEIGVFAHEDGGYDLLVGELGEGEEGAGLFRGNFNIIHTIE